MLRGGRKTCCSLVIIAAAGCQTGAEGGKRQLVLRGGAGQPAPQSAVSRCPGRDTCVNNRLDLLSKFIHTPATMINATPQQLRKAANIQEKIQSLQKKLGELLGSPDETAASKAPKKRKVSAAGIANMRAAQKARWAKIKRAARSGSPASKLRRRMSAQGLANIRAGVRKRMLAQAKRQAAQKPKRKISAAAKARLSALAKARWAEVKKAGKSRL